MTSPSTLFMPAEVSFYFPINKRLDYAALNHHLVDTEQHDNYTILETNNNYYTVTRSLE